jgi:hypothetical protein
MALGVAEVTDAYGRGLDIVELLGPSPLRNGAS